MKTPSVHQSSSRPPTSFAETSQSLQASTASVCPDSLYKSTQIYTSLHKSTPVAPQHLSARHAITSGAKYSGVPHLNLIKRDPANPSGSGSARGVGLANDQFGQAQVCQLHVPREGNPSN